MIKMLLRDLSHVAWVNSRYVLLLTQVEPHSASFHFQHTELSILSQITQLQEQVSFHLNYVGMIDFFT